MTKPKSEYVPSYSDLVVIRGALISARNGSMVRGLASLYEKVLTPICEELQKMEAALKGESDWSVPPMPADHRP